MLEVTFDLDGEITTGLSRSSFGRVVELKVSLERIHERRESESSYRQDVQGLLL